MKYGPMNKWRDEVDALCRKFGAEPIIAEGTNQEVKRLIIVSPKELSNEEQTSLARCIPTVVAVEFKVQAITDWKNLLNITCAKYNVEPVISKRNATSDAIQSLQFNCPRELTADERTAIIAPIPQGINMTFNVAPKQSTIGQLNMALLLMGTRVDSVNYDSANRSLEILGHGLSINIPEQGPVNLGEILPQLPPEVWDRLSFCLKGDGAIDSCKLSCDGHDISMDVKNTVKPESDDIEEPEVTGIYEACDQQNRERVKTRDLHEKPAVETKKPERDICPTADEITNLKIDLGNAKTIDDVLCLMGVNTQK